jgi:uncharacterized membrane protein
MALARYKGGEAMKGNAVNHLFGVLVAVAVLLTACNMHVDKNVGLASGNDYAAIEARILKPKCIDCHSGMMPQGGIDLSSYNAVMSSGVIAQGDPEKSDLFLAVNDGSMPLGKPALSKEEKDMIFNWIKGGAQQKDAPTPTFTWLNKNIFEKRCVVCHNSVKPRGKVDLSSYQALMESQGGDHPALVPRDAEKSGLYLEVAEQKMPPKAPVYSAEELKALSDWIVKGAPEVTPGTVLP